MSEGDFRASRPPSYDFLKRKLFLKRIDIRFNKEEKIIGLSFKIHTERSFNIIVKKPGANPNDLMFSDNKNPKDKMQDAVEKFKKEFSTLKEEYENTPSEITQELVDDVFFDADDGDDGSGGGSDNSSVLSDEQIWAENEIIARTRRAVFEEAEGKMEEYRDQILQDILDEADGENPFPDTEDGTTFHDHVVFITDPISNMDWFEEEAWSISARRPPNERYEREMDVIYDARKDIKERIKKATSGKQIMTYETLKGYLDYKELSLKTYFDKKINENRLISMYRRFQRTKAYRYGVIKAARWVAKRFPKAMAGAIIGVLTTAFGIYEAVEDMAGDVVAEGTKAINSISKKVDKVVKDQKKMIDDAVGKLDKRLKDAAEKQGRAVKAALDELRKTLGPTSKGLKFLLDHILWVIFGFVFLLILIIIILLYKRRRGGRSRGPRVKVKYEHESSDED